MQDRIDVRPLTRDRILAADDLRRELVPVPEWGGPVFVRVMTGSQRARFETETNGPGKLTVRERLIAATACDEGGHLLFTAGDVAALAEKSGAALDRLAEVALRLNRIGPKDVDDLEKNSGSPPSSSTPTA